MSRAVCDAKGMTHPSARDEFVSSASDSSVATNAKKMAVSICAVSHPQIDGGCASDIGTSAGRRAESSRDFSRPSKRVRRTGTVRHSGGHLTHKAGAREGPWFRVPLEFIHLQGPPPCNDMMFRCVCLAPKQGQKVWLASI